LYLYLIGLTRQTAIGQKEKGGNSARTRKTHDANDAGASGNRWVSFFMQS